MGKRIRITEAQYRELREKLINEVNVDVSQAVKNDGYNLGSNFAKAKTDARQSGLNPQDTTFTFKVDESSKCFTKKQLKEARRNKLMAETKKVVKKKNVSKKK